MNEVPPRRWSGSIRFISTPVTNRKGNRSGRQLCGDAHVSSGSTSAQTGFDWSSTAIWTNGQGSDFLPASRLLRTCCESNRRPPRSGIVSDLRWGMTPPWPGRRYAQGLSLSSGTCGAPMRNIGTAFCKPASIAVPRALRLSNPTSWIRCPSRSTAIQDDFFSLNW